MRKVELTLFNTVNTILFKVIFSNDDGRIVYQNKRFINKK